MRVTALTDRLDGMGRVTGETWLRAALVIVVLVALLGAPARAAEVPPERALYGDAPSGLYLLESGWSTRPGPERPGPATEAGSGRVRSPASARWTVPHAFDVRAALRKGFRCARAVVPHTFDLPAAATPRAGSCASSP